MQNEVELISIKKINLLTLLLLIVLQELGKIRSFVYTTQTEWTFQLEQGAYSYDKAKVQLGKELTIIRLKLDASYS